MLLNLTTIGKIGPGDKIYVDKGRIFISPSSFGRPIYRWLCGQNRYNSTEYVKTVCDYAIAYTSALINFVKFKKDEEMDETAKKAFDEIKILSETLAHTLRGLEQFKITYKYDRSVLSFIDVIVHKIHKLQIEFDSIK